MRMLVDELDRARPRRDRRLRRRQRPGAAVDVRRAQGPRSSRRSHDFEAGGSTNGGAGIQLAYDVARENFIEAASTA